MYLTGENETEPSSDVIAQVANEVYAQDLLSLMVVHMGKFEFEVGTHTVHFLFLVIFLLTDRLGKTFVTSTIPC